MVPSPRCTPPGRGCGITRRHCPTANTPPPQREVLALRYYADLTDAQIASAMGISIGAVKNHTTRGISAVRAALNPN